MKGPETFDSVMRTRTEVGTGGKKSVFSTGNKNRQ